MFLPPPQGAALPKAHKKMLEIGGFMDQAEIKCPGCDLVLPESDTQGQSDHMIANHPEIIIERLRSAGMHTEANELQSEQ